MAQRLLTMMTIMLCTLYNLLYILNSVHYTVSVPVNFLKQIIKSNTFLGKIIFMKYLKTIKYKKWITL